MKSMFSLRLMGGGRERRTEPRQRGVLRLEQMTRWQRGRRRLQGHASVSVPDNNVSPEIGHIIDNLTTLQQLPSPPKKKCDHPRPGHDIQCPDEVLHMGQ